MELGRLEGSLLVMRAFRALRAIFKPSLHMAIATMNPYRFVKRGDSSKHPIATSAAQLLHHTIRFSGIWATIVAIGNPGMHLNCGNNAYHWQHDSSTVRPARQISGAKHLPPRTIHEFRPLYKVHHPQSHGGPVPVYSPRFGLPCTDTLTVFGHRHLGNTALLVATSSYSLRLSMWERENADLPSLIAFPVQPTFL